MTTNKTPEKISKMFDEIAPSYDRNNNIISLGLHRIIKRKSLKELKLKDGLKILDICCGTGDIGKILLKSSYQLDITGIDFSENMIYEANKSITKTNKNKIIFIKADATDLPFENNSYNTVTMTFGLRNIQNRQKAIRETYRILKNGGELLHLDFGTKNLPSKIFDFIAKTGISLLYKNKLPYEYLINSKNEFPEPTNLIKEFEAEGFMLKKRKDFLFGVISMQIFTK